jgi:hypothetical protein
LAGLSQVFAVYVTPNQLKSDPVLSHMGLMTKIAMVKAIFARFGASVGLISAEFGA